MLHNIVFSEQALELQARAREIADKYVRPVAAKYDKAQEYNREAAEAVAEAGLFRVFIPEEYGGLGAGVLALCLVTEELSKADSGFGVAYAVNALGATPIVLGGTEEQKKRLLPAIARGEKLVAFCPLGEERRIGRRRPVRHGRARGGRIRHPRREEVDDERGRGRRLHRLLRHRSDVEVAPHQLHRGREGDARLQRRKVEDKMGIRCVPVVETHFDGVRVPADNLIGGREGMGFKNAMETLDRARPCVAAQAVGAAQGALDLAMVYANRRRQSARRSRASR